MSLTKRVPRRTLRRTSDFRRIIALVFALVLGLVGIFTDAHCKLSPSWKEFLERLFEVVDQPPAKTDSSTPLSRSRKGYT